MDDEWAIEVLERMKYPFPEHDKDVETNMAIDYAISVIKANPQK